MTNSINTQAIYNYYSNANDLRGIVVDNRGSNPFNRLNMSGNSLDTNAAEYLNRTKENRQKLINALKGAAGGDSSSYSTLRYLGIQLPQNATYGDPEVKKQLALLARRLEAIESNRPSLNADAYSKEGRNQQYNNLMVLQSQYKQRLNAQGVLDTTDLYGQSQIQGVQIDPTDIAGHTATIKESYPGVSNEFTTFSTKLKKEVDDRKAKYPNDPDTVRHIARATMEQLNNRIGALATNGTSRGQVLEDAFKGKGNPEILAYMDLYKRAVGANLPTNEAQLQANLGEKQVKQASFWPTQEELKTVQGGDKRMFRLAHAGNPLNAQVSKAIEARQTRFLTLGGGQTIYKGSDGKLYLSDTNFDKKTWVQTTEVSQIKINEETAKKYKGKGFADTDKRLSYDATIYSQKVDPKNKAQKGDLYATKVNYKDRKAVEKRRKEVVALATKAELKDSSVSASATAKKTNATTTAQAPKTITGPKGHTKTV